MSSPFYSLGEWLRRQQSIAQNYGNSLPGAPDSDQIGQLTRPSRPSLLNDFSAGLSGAPGYGQDVELPVSPVGDDGVPERIRRPETLMSDPTLAIERSIQGRSAILPDAPPPPLTVEQSVAASQPQSRVQVTINGKTYDYSNGRSGGAPLAGGQLGSMFGREWSNQPTDQTHEFAGEGNGSFSQMTELDPSMKTLQQLTDEQAHRDARPAEGGLLGANVGQQREIEKEIARKKAEQDQRVAAEIAIARGRGQVETDQQQSILGSLNQLDAADQAKLAEFRGSARYLQADPESRAKAEALLVSELEAARGRRQQNLGLATGRVNVSLRPGDPSAGFSAQ